ncbi:uncharacterized protein LOC17875381 [Capsella rubella]|uniref:uncharacterized protein LOC17875381 n=1 Tax=Capsella rubella TaxID=81985 RepID=UPI000CD59446|nr:uncharacterized protein LOC17875381 [Capsella rubella]
MDESRKENIQEEARRAKMIAVEKYNAGDLVGAKEFAVKAKNLDPKLFGVCRLNAVLNVHMAFEKKINGAVDWYGILSADPTEDLGKIYKHYTKTVMAIIRDRDDSIRYVEEAYKLMAAACRNLLREKLKQIYERKEAQPSSRVRFRKVEPPSRAAGHVTQLMGMNRPENKRKEPLSTDMPHLRQLRRISEKAGIRRDLALTRAAKTKTYQDSKNCDKAKRVKIADKEDPYVVDMSVPDPDFYHFDKDRMKNSFGDNQMWSVYDDYGMPRFYALVHKVVSREPFKLCISWINSKKNDELGPMKWIDSYYYKTSGNFSIGRRGNYTALNSFSHRVEWQKGAKGLVHIYPKKGNVWALYENWSPAWDISTSLEVMNKFEMVEVQQDFDDKVGVMVAPLVKLPGFHTVFRRHSTWRTYPRNELFRFSHQVASHLLTGEEDKNIPKGCLELDPAAMLPELLKVFTEEEMREVEDAVNKPKGVYKAV